jgi:hydroxyacylglutathione hydrolase
MDPGWLSNAYLVADDPGGHAVFIDSGAPLAPLLEVVERERLQPTHVLVTHGHHDHVAGNDELAGRFGVPVVRESVASGRLRVEALPTPGHSPDMLAFVVNETVCFTGDTLFRGSVGGTRDAFEELRRSIMDVLMSLPPGTRVLPGHTDETTIGREWDENPFVRVWRGVDAEGNDPCRVDGDDATLVVAARDYDGGEKVWVRFADGRNAIVGGSKVTRARA